MGSGKTTFGRDFAKYLCFDFIDMDEYIEINENKTINKIFEFYGEECFRKLEEKALEDIINNSKNNLVVSTGGGVILREKNRKLLKSKTTVIFLDTDRGLIKEHLINETSKRPLLNYECWKDRLDSIMDYRRKFYLITANILIKITSNDNSKWIKYKYWLDI